MHIVQERIEDMSAVSVADAEAEALSAAAREAEMSLKNPNKTLLLQKAKYFVFYFKNFYKFTKKNNIMASNLVCD